MPRHLCKQRGLSHNRDVRLLWICNLFREIVVSTADEPINDAPPTERRLMTPYHISAGVTMVRANDLMRTGVHGTLLDVSHSELGFSIEEPPELNEQIKLVLRNDVQRFEKATRGTVRQIDARSDGTFYVSVNLLLRLTPLDVSLLRMSL